MAKKLTIEEKLAQILAEFDSEEESKVKKTPKTSKNSKKEKTVNIEIIGDTYECNYISLSKSEYLDLLKKGMNSKTWKNKMEDLMGDSYINGYLFDKENAYFHVHVDGVENKKIITNFIKNKKNHFKSTLKNKKNPVEYYLAFEKWTKNGLMTKDVVNFDESKLELTYDDCDKPFISNNRVASLVYDGDYLDFETSDTVQESTYIYSTDGEKTELS